LISLSTFSQAQFRFQHLYGGVNNERGQTLLETFNNKYIFNGATTSYGQGSADAILIKNDNDGQVICPKFMALQSMIIQNMLWKRQITDMLE